MASADGNTPPEILALQRAMGRKVSAEAREDFRLLERILDAGACLQPYELELIQADTLPQERWTHVRACAACQLMLDGAGLPEDKEVAPRPVPAEFMAVVEAGADTVFARPTVGQRRHLLETAVPVCAILGVLVLGLAHLALQNQPATPSDKLSPSAAELFLRLKHTRSFDVTSVELSATDGSSYVMQAEQLTDGGALVQAAWALCIAEGLSKGDAKVAAEVQRVVMKLNQAIERNGE